MASRSKSYGKPGGKPGVESGVESGARGQRPQTLPVLPVLTALLVAILCGHATSGEPPKTVVDSLVESLVVLGENYEAGKWVRQSDLLAYMWYLLAATAGHETADAARHRIARRLSPAEIAAEQSLARHCHATKYWRCGETTATEDLTNIAGSDTVLRYSGQQPRQ